MPDISMCANGKDCKDKVSCYRYRAVPDPYLQSYVNYYPPQGFHRGTCDHFWQIAPGNKIRSIDEIEADAVIGGEDA